MVIFIAFIGMTENKGLLEFLAFQGFSVPYFSFR